MVQPWDEGRPTQSGPLGTGTEISLRLAMSIVASIADRFASRIAALGDRDRPSAVSFVGSLAAHLLCVALLVLVGIKMHDPSQATMTAIEVVIEPASALSAALQQASAADLDRGANSGWDSRPIADEERQKRGTPDARTLEGQGTAKVATLAPRRGVEKREGEDLRNDPDKEAIRIVPPRSSDTPWPREERLAPPGLEGAAWAPEGVKQDDKETSAKRHPIECGANVKTAMPIEAVLRRGQVWRELTEADKSRLKDISEARRDLFISPGYIDHSAVAVVVEGSRFRAAVSLPAGLTARSGDRIEFLTGHLDPAQPCHFIPNLATRVLATAPAMPGFGTFAYPPAFGSAPPARP
jgi:hypothetical protein